MRAMRRRDVHAGQPRRSTVHISLSPLQHFASDQLAFLRAVRFEHHPRVKHFPSTGKFYIRSSKRSATGRASLPPLRRCLPRPHQVLRQMWFDPCLARAYRGFPSIRTNIAVSRISITDARLEQSHLFGLLFIMFAFLNFKLLLPGKIA